jgi:hypothetical protein
MKTLLFIISCLWILSLLAFGVMAIWSMYADPEADGTWAETQRDGVGAGSGARETASTPSSVPTVGVHANAQE